jgi:hypothetical protein
MTTKGLITKAYGPADLLLGEYYVHGLMKGEAIDMLGREELQEKIFDIV